MISVLFQQRQKTITHDDLIKHNSRAVTFYSISKGKFVNDRLTDKTQPFSEQILIEIERGANRMIIGTDLSTDIYTRISPIEIDQYNGKGYLFWWATNERNAKYLVAKLLADDGTLQIKLVTEDNITHVVHNICELPQ